MTTRPSLGITACARAIGEEAAQAVMERYVAAAARHADCVPLLIPSLPDLASAEEVVARVDGVLLTGSPSNIDPRLYGDGPSDAGPFDAGRDTMALALIAACRAAGKPVFGICRGLQEINVAFGGGLARDRADADRALPHHAPADADLETMFGHRHAVTLAPGGVLARAIGLERLTVNSAHYQGIDRLGEGLSVEARADDGTIEAVAGPADGPPLLAVQWHPEWSPEEDPSAAAFFGLLGRALRGRGWEDGGEP